MLVLAGDDKVGGRARRGAQDARASWSTPSSPRRSRPTSPASPTYDSIVLADVPRLRLTDAQLAALQVYVRDLGGGW